MPIFISLGEGLKKIFFRFPIIMLWAVAGSVFLIGILFYQKDLDGYQNFIMVLALGVSWLIGCQFLSEALKHNTLSRFVFKALILSGLLFFYIYLTSLGDILPEQAYERWGLLMLAGHLFIGFSPFVFLWDKSLFWNYLKTIITAIVRSGIYAIVLYIGLALAISALEFLFDINFNDNIYLQTFIFCLGIVNTFVYLQDFPQVGRLDKSIDFSKAVEVLVLYILIPLSFLYILIVYAYALKILIDWELPRGWVTYLISGLSLLAFVIHIAIDPVRHKHDSKLIQKFFPYYFYAILPLLPLLFIALYRRIADYNFTELRYLGLVLAIWIAGMLVYMLVSKRKRLSLYAKTLFLLVLLCTFGPLSAFKISMNAQLNELGNMIENLNEKNEKSFSVEEYERFSSIIRYIAYRNNLEKTKAYLGFNPKTEFAGVSNSGLPKKIIDKLGVDVNFIAKKTWFNYNLINSGDDFNEEITSYTNFTILSLDLKKDDSKPLQLCIDKKNLISLKYFGETLMQTNMEAHLKTMANRYEFLNDAPKDDFTFRFKNENGDFLIIFESLGFEFEDNIIEIKSGKAMLFYMTYNSLELP